MATLDCLSNAQSAAALGWLKTLALKIPVWVKTCNRLLASFDAKGYGKGTLSSTPYELLLIDLRPVQPRHYRG
jgi:hypothetical protein